MFKICLVVIKELNMFGGNKGVTQNNAAVVRQAGATTGSAEMAKIM